MNDSHLIEELLGLLQKMHEERGVPEGESLENKNILQGNSPSDPNNRVSPALNSNERRRTTEIATLFARAFFDYTKKYKKDEKPKTLISQTRRVINPPPPREDGKKSGGLLGLLVKYLLPLASIFALIYGLITDGPLKGIMKILAKIGIPGVIKSMTKAVKGFVGMVSKFLKKPFEILMKLAKSVFKPIGGMISKMIPAGIKGLGKSFLGSMMKGLKPMLRVLKKIPILGSIISIGFAISRFKSGDNVGGVIDVLSALAGLLYLIPGGAVVALPLTIGLDVLNAFLDVKTAGAKDKQAAKMDILKSMGGAIMNKFKENAIYMPIIGGFVRFGRAFDAIKGGNIMEGLKELGLGLFTFVGGGLAIKGIEVLMGFFNSKQEEGSLSPDGSWTERLRKWIVGKLGDLPYAIRKPMEWFGIIKGSAEKSETWEGVKEAASKGMDGIIDFVSNTWGNISEAAKIGVDYVKSIVPGIVDRVKSIFNNVIEGFKDMAKKVGNWIKNLNPFKSSGVTQNWADEEERKLNERAKAAGHSSWKEYEKSGWAWKSGNVVVDKAVRDNQSTNKPKISTSSPPKTQVSVARDIRPASINQLQEAAKIQIKLLGEISHWGKLSLVELKRIGGSRGGGNNVSMNMSVPSPQSQSLEMVGDNRNGYASSVYALT